MIFFLGTHEPSWLERTKKPLFISRSRMSRRKRLPRSISNWALDSGAYTEISTHGRFLTSEAEYAEEASRYADLVGRLQWAAIQDWLVDDGSLQATGKTLKEHLELSVKSCLDLRKKAPCVQWIPILHGREPDDFFIHAEMYESAGIILRDELTIGIGSICSRQGDEDIAHLIQQLYVKGLNLHAFGMKMGGLKLNANFLGSADSMAWSFQARKRSPMEGCSHQSCSNCFRYASKWRRSIERILKNKQLLLESEHA